MASDFDGLLLRFGKSGRSLIAPLKSMALRRHNARIMRQYLRCAPMPRLHIGAGDHTLAGWLNTDLQPARGIMALDATMPYPFDALTFRYVFCEHMIEHVGFEQGLALLNECFRILQPNGVIRIVTPDLQRLLQLYDRPTVDRHAAYLEYFCRSHLPHTQPSTPVSAINAMMRMWGHQFIYDEASLSASLGAAGFKSIVRRRLGDSEHAALQNIEHESRYPPGLLDFESIALEGTK